MYDFVVYSAPCPNCGHTLTNWQTKDCCGRHETLQPWLVYNFHSICPACKAYVGAKVDAEVEHIVKRCDIALSFENWPPLPAVKAAP
jgi:hypothetical protein